MPDPHARARAYGQHAAEYMRLAGTAEDPALADQYRKLAVQYSELAVSELEAARLKDRTDKPPA